MAFELRHLLLESLNLGSPFGDFSLRVANRRGLVRQVVCRVMQVEEPSLYPQVARLRF